MLLAVLASIYTLPHFVLEDEKVDCYYWVSHKGYVLCHSVPDYVQVNIN